eukprot:GEMP01019114.1.p1 GENE.GEMP01019114.1~~GEMP01019114.1.p1  ORF type:complete len:538 (-),score=70.40 GEMP01019114.1:1027-2640(-)
MSTHQRSSKSGGVKKDKPVKGRESTRHRHHGDLKYTLQRTKSINNKNEQSVAKKHKHDNENSPAVPAGATPQKTESKAQDRNQQARAAFKHKRNVPAPRFAALVHGNAFEGVSAAFAFADCFFLAVLMDCKAKLAAYEGVGEKECSEERVCIFKVLNVGFLLVSTVEFFLRISVTKAGVLKDTGFLLNSVLTWFFGWLLVLLDYAMGGNDKIFWLTSLRVFRIVHVMRAVKLVGRNQYLKEVWLLIRGFHASIRTLVCSTLLLSVTIYVFAVVGTSLIGHSNKSSWTDQESLLRAERFDSLFTSILTLIRLLFADDSFDIMEAVSKEWPRSNIYFATFIGIAVFVVSNLIVAVIVEHALSITASDEEDVAHEKIQEKHKLMGRLADIFQELDRDGTGFVTFEEFVTSFHCEQMKYMLQSLDFDEKDLIDLFKTLDDDNAGCLNLDEFLVRMGRLSEEPCAKDFLSLMKLAQSCVDLAKLVAADDEANAPAAITDASGSQTEVKMGQLSGEVSLLNLQLKTLKPKWIDRMAHYRGSGS